MQEKVNQISILFDKTEDEIRNLDPVELYHEVQEKNKLIMQRELEFNQLREDFSYNIELIYQRDKDLEIQNRRIDELIALNQEKDFEIQSLQQYCKRMRSLEHDNIILSKRVEALMAANYKNLLNNRLAPQIIEKGDASVQHRRPIHSKYYSMNKDYEELEENNHQPLNQLNLELQRRIKILEQETNTKTSFHTENLSDNHSENNLETVENRDKLQTKGKELSELIKSLNPYKIEIKKKNNPKIDDNHFDLLNQDIERLKNEVSRPRSRLTALEEENLKHDSLIKRISSSDKQRNW